MDRVIGFALFAIVTAFSANFAIDRFMDVETASQQQIEPIAAAKIIKRSDGQANYEETRSRTVKIKAGRGGHFFSPAIINGKQANILVDTGASYVFFSYDQAKKLGITPSRQSFKYTSNTANGPIRVAPITLNSLRLGGIRLRQVKAAVAEEGVISEQILLGNSFLSRLAEVTIKNGILTLRQ